MSKRSETKLNRPISDHELKGLLKRQIDAGLNYFTDPFSKERIEAQKYYDGLPEILDAPPGRSTVISRDVAEAVDSLLPSLLRVFGSTDRPVRFLATKPQDEELAAQVTDYVNYIWSTQNDGFKIFYDWFKTALIFRLGAVKIYWDEDISIKVEEYKNLDEAEYKMLATDAEVTILDDSKEVYTDPDLEHSAQAAYELALRDFKMNQPQLMAAFEQQQAAYQQAQAQMQAQPPQAPPQGPPGQPPQAMPQPQMPPPPQMPQAPQKPDISKLPKNYDCKVHRKTTRGSVKIDLVPPEELLFDQFKVSQDDRQMIAHRRKMTASELRERGYDESKIDEIAFSANEQIPVVEKQQRFLPEANWALQQSLENDPSSKTVYVTEIFLPIDVDGDGLAEYRKITVAGDTEMTILENEIVDSNPFALLTPVPTPHKLVGTSITDQTKDLQRIKSTLWRQALDNVYTSVQARYVINQNVSLDDVLNPRPGSPIRTTGTPAQDIAPLPVTPIADTLLTLIQYVDGVRENRTGVTRLNQGLDANELQPQTASAVQLITAAGNMRMELVARHFAETGVKRAFRRILDLITKHEDKERMIKLRGKWVPIRPTDWRNQYDLSVTVGLGTGNRDQEMGRMLQLFPIAQSIIQFQGGIDGPLVKADNLHAMITKLIEAAGLRNPELYISDPAAMPPQPPQQPPPDPATAAAQVQLQIKQAELQQSAKQFDQTHQFQVDRTQAELQLKKQQLDQDHEAKMRAHEVDALRLHHADVATKSREELAALKIHHDGQSKAVDADLAALKLHHAAQQHATDTAVDLAKTAHQTETATTMAVTGMHNDHALAEKEQGFELKRIAAEADRATKLNAQKDLAPAKPIKPVK